MSEAFGGLSHLDYPDQTMNNAAADYARLAAANPSAFSKLRRSGDKGSIKTAPLSPLEAPTGASAGIPVPAPPTSAPHSSGPKNSLPTQSNLSSGPGLISRVMQMMTAPPPQAAGNFMQSQFNPFGPQPAGPGGGQPPQPPGQGGAPGSMLFGPDFRPPQFGPTPHTPFPPGTPSPPAAASPNLSPLAGGMVGPNPLANPPPTSLKIPPRPPAPTSLPIPPRPPGGGSHPALARLQSIINSLPIGSWFGSPDSRGYAEGGVVNLMRGGYPVGYPMGLPTRHYERGDYVSPDGEGDGRSDHIRANLSPGEFVMDAETTSLLGNGDNEAGARKWEAIRQHIRKKKGRALAKGRFSPDADSPDQLASMAMGRRR